eukprot:7667480-Alexandrium_andersonii.AAC.1
MISGGMSALRLPAFFEHLGRSKVILMTGCGPFARKNGLKHGVVACWQCEEAWKLRKAGAYCNVSMSDGV